MSYMCWENYFTQPIMKVIGKRKSFKTNNSSEVLYGLHISKVPNIGWERCDERFGEKLHSNSCHSQLCWIQSCLAGGSFAALLWGRLGSLHSVNLYWIYY